MLLLLLGHANRSRSANWCTLGHRCASWCILWHWRRRAIGMPTAKKTSTFMAPAASIKHDQTKKSRPNNERFHVYSHKKQLKTYIQQTFDRVAVANTNWLITFIHCKKKTISSARRKVVNHMTIIIFRYTFNK